jgi:hypothetical protein
MCKKDPFPLEMSEFLFRLKIPNKIKNASIPKPTIATKIKVKNWAKSIEYTSFMRKKISNIL